MAKMLSNMLPLKTKAPEFSLIDTVSDKHKSYTDLRGSKGTIVAFICNHCPFVHHLIDELVKISEEYKEKGIYTIAISSNDINNYPEDAPDKMTEFASKYKFNFPYLFDDTQDVARSYDAACTPDFYIFDDKDQLFYRGQLDRSTPSNGVEVSGDFFRMALNKLLNNEMFTEKQSPSVGCGIKWKK